MKRVDASPSSGAVCSECGRWAPYEHEGRRYCARNDCQLAAAARFLSEEDLAVIREENQRSTESALQRTTPISEPGFRTSAEYDAWKASRAVLRPPTPEGGAGE